MATENTKNERPNPVYKMSYLILLGENNLEKLKQAVKDGNPDKAREIAVSIAALGRVMDEASFEWQALKGKE